jgi:hypothetical protein
VVFWGEVLNANRILSTVVQLRAGGDLPRRYADVAPLPLDVRITLLSAGLIFLLALILGIWKYRQILASPEHRAHPYVDIAHRAALLYSFATLLVAVFVELSAWPIWVNLTAAMVLVFFFVTAIAAYVQHGLRRDTTNQFENPTPGLHAGMMALMAGEIGGFLVLFAGFVAAQFG